MSQLFSAIFYEKHVAQILIDEAMLDYMLQAEVVQAQATIGVIPKSAANPCQSRTPSANDR